MPRSLWGRLAVALAAILAVLGVVFTIATITSSRAFFAEINQGLHRELARHLVAESLPMKDGEIQDEALEHIFHMLMVVNPSIEVYLLDGEGAILSYSAPSDAVVLERVDLEPVRAFLGEESSLPIWGDDPRDRDRRRVFSAAPVGERGSAEGYLYVVLGGEQLDSAFRMVRTSHGLRVGLGASALLLVFALLTGLLLFAFMTRRLRSLDVRMRSFRESDFTAPPEAAGGLDRRDEIDRLQATFDEMADRLVGQLDELRKTDELRRELVANVSHDLKTPLTSLRGYLETLRVMEDLEPDERRHYLETALRQTRHLGRLVNELLELARLDSATIEMRCEPLALSELVQDLVQQFQLSARERGVELSCDLPSGPARVDGDVGLISRALENLIDNGLRYTPAGGRVAVKVTANGSRVGVKVEDTGRGIAAEDVPRVFDRFFRSHDGAGGAGLGLAIAKRVVELHGGSIRVRSAPGQGASFELDLPTAAA